MGQTSRVLYRGGRSRSSTGSCDSLGDLSKPASHTQAGTHSIRLLTLANPHEQVVHGIDVSYNSCPLLVQAGAAQRTSKDIVYPDEQGANRSSSCRREARLTLSHRSGTTEPASRYRRDHGGLFEVWSIVQGKQRLCMTYRSTWPFD